MLFNNIIINDSNRGIGLFSRDNSNISDVTFTNIIMETRLHSDGWWGKSEPIHISAIPSSKNGNSGIINNITFNNIKANSESGIVIYGEGNNVIKRIKMTGISVKINSGVYSRKYGGNFDLRPSFSVKKGLFKRDIAAFYASGVKGLELDDILLEWKNPTSSFFTNGLEVESFENLIVRNFNISAAYDHENLFDIKLSKGENYKLINDLSFNKKTKIFYPKND